MGCPAHEGKCECEHYLAYKYKKNMARCNLAEKPLKLMVECPKGMGSWKKGKVRRYN